MPVMHNRLHVRKVSCKNMQGQLCSSPYPVANPELKSRAALQALLSDQKTTTYPQYAGDSEAAAADQPARTPAKTMHIKPMKNHSMSAW